MRQSLATLAVLINICSVTTPSLVRFAPSLMYIATLAKVRVLTFIILPDCQLQSIQQDNAIRLYSTTSGRLTQTIPHARPVVDFSWRHSQASSRSVPTALSSE
jgi:hypothetical protein